jgi:hypothetical protein
MLPTSTSRTDTPPAMIAVVRVGRKLVLKLAVAEKFTVDFAIGGCGR